jgi:hypothetical protein
LYKNLKGEKKMKNTQKMHTIYFDEKTGWIANRYYYPFDTSPSKESHSRQEDGTYVLNDGFRSVQISEEQMMMINNNSKKYFAWKYLDKVNAEIAKKYGVETGSSFLTNERVENTPTEEALGILRDWRTEQLNQAVISPDWWNELSEEQRNQFRQWRQEWKDITEPFKNAENGNAFDELTYDKLPKKPSWLR